MISFIYCICFATILFRIFSLFMQYYIVLFSFNLFVRFWYYSKPGLRINREVWYFFLSVFYKSFLRISMIYSLYILSNLPTKPLEHGVFFVKQFNDIFILLIDIKLFKLSVLLAETLQIWGFQGIWPFNINCQIYWYSIFKKYNILVPFNI